MRRIVGSERLGARGFTMIEVIGVLVLVGILAVVFVGRLASPASELRAQTELLKTNLRFCQFKALSDISNPADSWGMSFTGSSYTLRRNGANAPINLPNENSPTHSLGTGVAFSTVPAEIFFNEWGSPGGADITITLAQSGQTQTVTLTRNTGYIP